MTRYAADLKGDTPDIVVSRSVLSAIERQKITRKTLEERLFVGEGWLSNRIKGKTKWTVSDVFKVASGLGIDPLDVFSGRRW